MLPIWLDSRTHATDHTQPRSPVSARHAAGVLQLASLPKLCVSATRPPGTIPVESCASNGMGFPNRVQLLMIVAHNTHTSGPSLSKGIPMVDSPTRRITFLMMFSALLATGCGIRPMTAPKADKSAATNETSASTSPSQPAANTAGESATPGQAPGPLPNDPAGDGAAFNHVTQTDTRPSAPVSAARQNTQTAFHLSAGAALPQSLPMGTVMSFSVDYQQRGQLPSGSVNYLWVIKGVSGSTHRQPVRLKSNGTLTTIVPGLRPEAGPFECHLAAYRGSRGQPQPVSNSIPLR